MKNTNELCSKLIEISNEIDAEHEHEFKVGNQFKTNNYGVVEIVEYLNCKNILVRFANTGYEVRANASNIRQGKIKDRMTPSILGIGILGNAKTTDSTGRQKKSYCSWGNMLKRVTTRENYRDVEIEDSFIRYSDFDEWYIHNASLYPEDLREKLTVDSDILPFVRGTLKSYGAETCILIRNNLNTSFMHIENTLNNLSSSNPEESHENARLIIEKFVGKFEKDALPYLPKEIQTELMSLETKLWEFYFKVY